MNESDSWRKKVKEKNINKLDKCESRRWNRILFADDAVLKGEKEYKLQGIGD